MNRDEFYRRISDLLNTRDLESKAVAVIGLGSGGSRVAAELGRLGIRLLLVERPGELLEEHNIVRHLLGYSSLGKPKLTEMVAYIRNLNPGARVTAWPLDAIDQARHLGRLLEERRPDLIAVCTDNEPSKHAINQLALRLGIPQIGGAVYDGGIGGEVYRASPGKACYGCIAAQLQLRHQPRGSGQVQDYSNPNIEEAQATCALSLDIEQIALLQCRMALDLLLGKENALLRLPPEVNLCVFANRVVPGAFSRPLRCEFFNVPKRADCLECGEAPPQLEAEAERILCGLRSPAIISPSGS
jgi:molybdopterin/thiamine biosynthesis adenylyltransferase